MGKVRQKSWTPKGIPKVKTGIVNQSGKVYNSFPSGTKFFGPFNGQEGESPGVSEKITVAGEDVRRPEGERKKSREKRLGLHQEEDEKSEQEARNRETDLGGCSEKRSRKRLMKG